MPTCTVCELHAESTFRVDGMDCHEEVALIERRFRHLAGIESFHADVMGRRLHVRYDAATLTTAATTSRYDLVLERSIVLVSETILADE